MTDITSLITQIRELGLVNALEWKGRFAHTQLGLLYVISEYEGGAILEKIDGPSTMKSVWDSEDEAKASAQSDYEQRIVSSLNPVTVSALLDRIDELEKERDAERNARHDVLSELEGHENNANGWCDAAIAQLKLVHEWRDRATDAESSLSEARMSERIYSYGDRLRKKSGSSWQGHVVGFYSTLLTPVGYCIESEREPGSVQIYPESALERVHDDGGANG